MHSAIKLLVRLATAEQGQVLSVAFLFQALGGDEAQRSRVHAKAQAGGSRAVIEDMAQVGIRMLRTHLGARQDELEIGARGDVLRFQRPGEAWPARARVIFIQRAEQRLAGYHVHIDAGVLVVPILVVEGRLGAFVLCDLILQ